MIDSYLDRLVTGSHKVVGVSKRKKTLLKSSTKEEDAQSVLKETCSYINLLITASNY